MERKYLPDHYATLSNPATLITDDVDIPSTADRDTIREAYKRAAFANHPDRAVDEADRKERTILFQKINEAHYILSNDERVHHPNL